MNESLREAHIERRERDERRDRFAAAALQGLLAKYGALRLENRDEIDIYSIAHDAINYADALIVELDKP